LLYVKDEVNAEVSGMGAKVDKFESSVDENTLKIRKSPYLQALKTELKQVSWTSKDELAKLAKIVLGSTFALGLTIYAADLLIKGCLTSLKALIHLIFG
jgi:preprotein translocase subunit SecE